MSKPTDKQMLDWLERQWVRVCIPLRYGHKDAFTAEPDLEEERSDLRERLAEAMEKAT